MNEKSSAAIETNVDSIFGDISVAERTGDKSGRIRNTTAGDESYHITEETAVGKNVSTLESLRQEFGEVSPDIIKKINRQVTSKIAPTEKRKIFIERDELVEKKFREGLSIKQENRLAYVRWQLDRFDDVETGEFLDYFEKVTETHEKLVRELKGFSRDIENIQINKPKKKKSKYDR